MATNPIILNNGIEMPVIGFGVFETLAGDRDLGRRSAAQPGQNRDRGLWR